LSISPSQFIQVGKLGRPKGTKGLLRFHSFLNDDRDINKFKEFFLENKELITIKLVSFDKKSPLVTLNNFIDRNAIEKFVNQKVYLERNKLEPTQENEFYFHELEGLDVLNSTEEIVGKVSSVVNFGAGDLLEIHFIKSQKNEFFRFTKENFPSVNIKEKKIYLKS
jgi:16S rRNA processing protein RimM